MAEAALVDGAVDSEIRSIVEVISIYRVQLLSCVRCTVVYNHRKSNLASKN